MAGQRGPLPKPTAELNSWRADKRKADGEPQVEVKAPEMPRLLKGYARDEWRRITPRLVSMGVIGEIDRGAIERYCRAWARLHRMNIAWDSRTIDPDTGEDDEPDMEGCERLSQFAGVIRNQEAHVDKLAAVLGLGPAHRARVRKENAPPSQHGNAGPKQKKQAKKFEMLGPVGEGNTT